MLKQNYRCTECGNSFATGEWTGCRGDEGVRHRVAPRTFYSRYDGNVISWKVDRRYADKQGNMQYVPGRVAKFRGGIFLSRDPEEQEALQEKLNKGGLLTKEKYETLRLTPKLRADRAEATVAEQRNQIAALRARLADAEAEKQEEKPKRAFGRRKRA